MAGADRLRVNLLVHAIFGQERHSKAVSPSSDDRKPGAIEHLPANGPHSHSRPLFQNLARIWIGPPPPGKKKSLELLPMPVIADNAGGPIPDDSNQEEW